MNKAAIKKAIYELLCAVGENPHRAGLSATPERVTELISDLLSGTSVDPITVLESARPVDAERAERGELVAVKGIRFISVCEHHLLPFEGKATVVYQPEKSIVGFGTLARLVEVASRRLQLQERLGQVVAAALVESQVARGSYVQLSSVHGCVAYRGPSQNLTSVTVAIGGSLETGTLREEAAALASTVEKNE